MFQDGSVKLPVTYFMDQLKEALNKEQVEQTAEDIKKTIEGKKEEFCKADYMSLQDAKTQLTTLLTEVMMDEAGFIIDQSLQDCRKQTEDLKREKDHLNQYKDTINVKNNKNHQLRK